MKDEIYLAAICCADVPMVGLDKDDIIYRNTMYPVVGE
jgi:hypothetical protein